MAVFFFFFDFFFEKAKLPDALLPLSFFIHRTRCALKTPHIIIHAFQLPVLKAIS